MSARQLIRGYEVERYRVGAKPKDVIVKVTAEARMTIFAFQDTRRLWLPTKRLLEILGCTR